MGNLEFYDNAGLAVVAETESSRGTSFEPVT